MDRPYDEVARDVMWGKVSREGARAGYGVVVEGEPDDPVVDVAASDALRQQVRSSRGEQPFFDRGPGYARLAGGAASADLDWL
jgi:N-methylhydantoinase B